MNNIHTFDELAEQYDRWFDEHPLVYESELQGLCKFRPSKGLGIEIGAGTGRFAKPLGIDVGVEPAGGMAELSRRALREAHRILKPRGHLLIGMIDRDTPLGQAYLSAGTVLFRHESDAVCAIFGLVE